MRNLKLSKGLLPAPPPYALTADLVVCVSQEPDEVMFLEAGGGEVRGDVGAGSQGGQALLQPHSLGVLRVGHCKEFFKSSVLRQKLADKDSYGSLHEARHCR